MPIWLDDKLSFKVHMDNLVRKLKLNLFFCFRNKASFPLMAFLSVIDYGDLLYMHATSSILQRLDSVYHASMRFITNAKPLTHHCTLYQMVGWTSLHMRRKIHLYVFIYKSLLGQLPLYICSLVSFTTSSYHTGSARWMLLKVPRTFRVLGKTAFSSCAPEAWNSLQSMLHLDMLVPLN